MSDWPPPVSREFAEKLKTYSKEKLGGKTASAYRLLLVSPREATPKIGGRPKAKTRGKK